MTGGKQPNPSGGQVGHGRTTGGPMTNAPKPEPGAVMGKPNPPYDVIGVDAISPMLEYVDFPTNKERLAASLGDVLIPVGRNETKPFREILDKVTPEEFGDNRALENAIKARWDLIGTSEERGGKHWQRDNVEERPTRGG